MLFVEEIAIKSEKKHNFLMSLCTKLGTCAPQQWRAVPGARRIGL